MPERSAPSVSALRLAKPRRGIQSIETGMSLLLALGRHGRPMALGDLARAADMPTGKAHPYLVSFTKTGFVVQSESTGQYWLGPTAIQLGLIGLRTLDPVREATPAAEQLAVRTGHSVALSVWGTHGPTIVRQIDPIYPLHTNLRTGTVMSLAGTATGRLFAALLPERLIRDLMKDDHGRLGAGIAAPLNAAQMSRQLAEVRRRGLARAIGRPTPGVNAFAAPVFDYSGNIVLAITLMGSAGLFDTAWTGPQAQAVLACARDASRRLGDPSTLSTTSPGAAG